MPTRPQDWKKLEAAKQQSVGQLLLKCARLLDERALARVNAAGAKPKPPIRPAHTRLFPHIDPQGTRLTEVARRVGITKQAVGQLVAELEQHGVLELVEDPTDGRARLVRFTPRGVEALHHGLSVLGQIEGEIATKVGVRKVAALRETLSEVLAALEAM